MMTIERNVTALCRPSVLNASDTRKSIWCTSTASLLRGSRPSPVPSGPHGGLGKLGPVLGERGEPEPQILLDGPVAQKNDPLRVVSNELVVVRRHENGGSGAIDPQQDLEDLLRHLGVEIPRGLVREKDLGAVDDRASDRHPLLLASGERHRPVVSFVIETHLA